MKVLNKSCFVNQGASVSSVLLSTCLPMYSCLVILGLTAQQVNEIV